MMDEAAEIFNVAAMEVTQARHDTQALDPGQMRVQKVACAGLTIVCPDGHTNAAFDEDGVAVVPNTCGLEKVPGYRVIEGAPADETLASFDQEGYRRALIEQGNVADLDRAAKEWQERLDSRRTSALAQGERAVRRAVHDPMGRICSILMGMDCMGRMANFPLQMLKQAEAIIGGRLGLVFTPMPSLVDMLPTAGEAFLKSRRASTAWARVVPVPPEIHHLAPNGTDNWNAADYEKLKEWMGLVTKDVGFWDLHPALKTLKTDWALLGIDVEALPLVEVLAAGSGDPDPRFNSQLRRRLESCAFDTRVKMSSQAVDVTQPNGQRLWLLDYEALLENVRNLSVGQLDHALALLEHQETGDLAGLDAATAAVREQVSLRLGAVPYLPWGQCFPGLASCLFPGLKGGDWMAEVVVQEAIWLHREGQPPTPLTKTDALDVTPIRGDGEGPLRYHLQGAMRARVYLNGEQLPDGTVLVDVSRGVLIRVPEVVRADVDAALPNLDELRLQEAVAQLVAHLGQDPDDGHFAAVIAEIRRRDPVPVLEPSIWERRAGRRVRPSLAREAEDVLPLPERRKRRRG